MGLLISSALLTLLHWGLKLTQLGGAALCLAGLALLLQRFPTAHGHKASGRPHQATTTWAAPVLGGIGIALLVTASAALIMGERLGVFTT